MPATLRDAHRVSEKANAPKLDSVLPEVANTPIHELATAFSVAQLRQLALTEIPEQLEKLQAKARELDELKHHILGTLIVDPRNVKTAGIAFDGPSEEARQLEDDRQARQHGERSMTARVGGY